MTGDPDRLGQVVGNLVANAIKYTPEDGRVAVSLSATDEEARIVVEDSGRGVPQEERALLFDRLYRSEQTRRTRAPGVGLGLTIAKAIVELHSGRIEVGDSDLGGARFEVVLPLHPG
jgi:signal transduction histidine kinase